MLTNIRSQGQGLAIMIGLAVLCEVVAHSTNDKRGIAQVVSWTTFVGFWVAAIAAVALVALLAVTVVRAMKARS